MRRSNRRKKNCSRDAEVGEAEEQADTIVREAEEQADEIVDHKVDEAEGTSGAVVEDYIMLL